MKENEIANINKTRDDNNKINTLEIKNNNNEYSSKREKNGDIYNHTIINSKLHKKEKSKKKINRKKIKDKCCCCKCNFNTPTCAFCCGNRGFIGFYCYLFICLFICLAIAKAIWH